MTVSLNKLLPKDEAEGLGRWLSWSSGGLTYTKLQVPFRHHISLVHTCDSTLAGRLSVALV